MSTILEEKTDELHEKLQDMRQNGIKIHDKECRFILRRFLMNLCLDTFEDETFHKQLKAWKDAES